MNRAKIMILAIVAVLIAGGAYVGVRLAGRGKDIIGVTTLPDENIVIMNARSGDEFVSGSGNISVKEGQKIYLSHDLKSGSFDLAIGLSTGTGEPEDAGDLPEGYLKEKDGIEGKGEQFFELEGGDYTVVFTMHGAIGTARIYVR